MRRDDPDVAALAMDDALPCAPAQIIAALAPRVTAARLGRMQQVIAARTRRITLVLDDLADPHNAAAILRSADAFGVQDVTFVGRKHAPVAARAVAKGAERWLTLQRFADVDSCAGRLQACGYRIAVAAMGATLSPQDLADVGAPIALVFGNEHAGPDPRWQAHAHCNFAVPMVGFVESLNVSVAAAATLAVLRPRLVHPRQPQSHLSDAEQQRLLAHYLLRSVRGAHLLLAAASHAKPAPAQAMEPSSAPHSDQHPAPPREPAT
ncbi:MAG: TrmH family RNA methyltransferase [Polyangiales bacterium]